MCLDHKVLRLLSVGPDVKGDETTQSEHDHEHEQHADVEVKIVLGKNNFLISMHPSSKLRIPPAHLVKPELLQHVLSGLEQARLRHLHRDGEVRHGEGDRFTGLAVQGGYRHVWTGEA